jgi:hypothetical protein
MPTSRCEIRERLVQGFITLERLDLIRMFRKDPTVGKATERKIIHRELLDLELQEMDEQLDRICTVSTALGLPSRTDDKAM